MRLSMLCTATALALAMLAGAAAQSASQPSARGGQMATKPAESGPVTIANELRKDWANQKETMMAIADAMPAEKFGYKPTPAQRSFGEQILHVAGANVMIMKLIDPSAAAPAIDQKTTNKTAILKALSDSYDFGEAALKAQTDQSIQQVVNDAPRYLGPSTRARLVYQTMIHAEDEYGAMTVYLRLNDIVPPASRRGGM